MTTTVLTIGHQGPPGPPSLTTTTASFTMPAVNASATATVGNTSWMTAGMPVLMLGAGQFTVATTPAPFATTVSLTNTGASGNALPNTVVAQDAIVAPGVVGAGAFTFTTGAFTMPAQDGVTTVTPTVVNAPWVAVGQYVYVAAAGYLKVTALPSSTSVTLVNPPGLPNATPGTVIATNASVAPAGPPVGTPTGSGIWHSASSALDATVSKGTAGQFIVTNAAASDTPWVSLSGDVLASTSTPGSISVTGLRSNAVPALAAGFLRWTGSAFAWTAAASTVTGSGFFHATAGAQDAAASIGTAGQFPITNAAASDTPWTSLSGDVVASTSTPGAITVAKIQGNPVSATPATAGQILVENAGATGSAWVTPSGDVSISPTGATALLGLSAGLTDVGSLVFGDVADTSWSQVSAASAPGVSTSANALAQGDGDLDQVLANYGGNTFGAGILDRPFIAPPGVTQVQFAIPMALPNGVGSASVAISIERIYPTQSVLTTSTVSLTASFVTYTTAAVSVSSSGGTGAAVLYVARIKLNATSNQAKALLGRASIQVVASSDSFWTGAFTRIEPLPHTLKNNGYAAKRLTNGQYAYYWFVSPHAQLEFDTNATTIVLEAVNTINGQPASAIFRIDINGRFNQLVDFSGQTNTWNTIKVTIPAGLKRVTITNGGYTGAASPNGLLSVSMATITAVYLNAGAYFAGVQTGRTRNQVVVYGDSKGCGQLATTILASGLPALMRRKNPGDVAFDAWGGRRLFDESSVTATAQAQLLATYRGDSYVVQIGRNDWSGQATTSPWATAAAFGTRYGQMLDALHAAAPNAQIVVATASSENAEGNNSQGWSMADQRAQVAGAFATRTAFCKIVDLAALWPNGAGSAPYLADGTHPNDLGQALTSDALLGPDGLGVEAGPLTSPLSIPGCTLWTPAMAAVASGGVVTSLPDLSGSGNNLVPINSPTLLTADINGHPAVRFIGASSQTLGTSANGAICFTTACTIMIVQKFDIVNGNAYSCMFGTLKSGDINGISYWGSNGSSVRGVYTGGPFSTDGTSPTVYEITTIQFTNGVQVAMWVNGAAQSMSALTAFSAMDANSRVTLGGGWNDVVYSNFFTGKLADVAVWNNVISATAQTAAQRWLGTKYGIVVP